jgi:hypothetical protein
MTPLRFMVGVVFSVSWLNWGSSLGFPLGSTAGIAAPSPLGDDPVFLRPVDPCPEEVNRLVSGLLQDLPSYANRVASRSLGHPAEQIHPFGAVLIASQPDFEPLDLSEQAFGAGLDQASAIQQVFFTTLERHYRNNQAVSLQNYHWLFLVRSEDGWRLALLYSSVGAYPAAVRSPTPPEESSDGIVGQAVRLWLRDCRAGAVFLPDAMGE